MRGREFAGGRCRLQALMLIPVIMSAGGRADDDPMGWSPEHIPPADPWREDALELPDYPAEKRLAEIPAMTGSYPYDVYIDTGSLSRGKDGVVRYTVVVRSHAGAENITYEGLHCQERTFRRFAYGDGGNWRPVDGGSWQAVKPGGMNHYRYVLYSDYLCDPTNPAMKTSEMIQRMRSSQGMILDD